MQGEGKRQIPYETRRPEDLSKQSIDATSEGTWKAEAATDDSGRSRPTRTQELEEAVLCMVNENPNVNTRQVATVFNVHRTYNLQRLQALTPGGGANTLALQSHDICLHWNFYLWGPLKALVNAMLVEYVGIIRNYIMEGC
ncbi:hypothetical protein PR048_016261 [Dryococelus australis]|uniref:HTH psq-type domain-containing protein n=1 Tax=Dryococelus australis TaxID=614101 RepID=A0ABQ9HJ88_9NEOP|nr:hypothetical protein PR048_016261 [Dryococelus australis]